MAEFWEPFFLRCDANNLLSQLWTWAAGDISDNAIFKGDFEAALRAIKARTIILPAELDRYFPPVDADYEAKRIPNAECRVVKSVWGAWDEPAPRTCYPGNERCGRACSAYRINAR